MTCALGHQKLAHTFIKPDRQCGVRLVRGLEKHQESRGGANKTNDNAIMDGGDGARTKGRGAGDRTGLSLISSPLTYIMHGYICRHVCMCITAMPSRKDAACEMALVRRRSEYE